MEREHARSAAPYGQLIRRDHPTPILTQLGVTVGDSLEVTMEAGRLVLAPLPGHPRARWAEAAREIAALGDDALVWPEFGNAVDTTLGW